MVTRFPKKRKIPLFLEYHFICQDTIALMAIQIASLPSPIMFASNTSPRTRQYSTSSSSSSSTSMAQRDSMDIGDSGVLDIQRALDIARNTEGDLDHFVAKYLEEQLTGVWNRLESRPDSYVLSKDEFAIFNFFVGRYQESAVAEKAIARFWSSYQDNGSS
ncbi:hypothetical protein D6D01_02852 [Aureobasidium pullulans]|uniref:Uncharacterized protein n=1 Tax=Aureobasidium pullulans TaxID=5580 RepID=A0A4V6TF07_AURPU|nr:hypothetical protein D6D01_02852 [Aureobasidium pullulans]